MHRDSAVLNMVPRIFLRVITQSLTAHCPGAEHVDTHRIRGVYRLNYQADAAGFG